VGKLSLYADIFTHLLYLLMQLVRAANYDRWCRWCRWWLQSNLDLTVSLYLSQ